MYRLQNRTMTELTDDQIIEMRNRYIKEGMEHSVPSRDTLKKFNEIETRFDAHEVRIQSLVMRGLVGIVFTLFGMIGSAIYYGINVGTLSNNVSHLQEEIKQKASKEELQTILARIESQNRSIDQLTKSVDKLTDRLNK